MYRNNALLLILRKIKVVAVVVVTEFSKQVRQPDKEFQRYLVMVNAPPGKTA